MIYEATFKENIENIYQSQGLGQMELSLAA